jgi:hypothetical protein
VQPPTGTEKGVSAVASCNQARAPGGAARCSARAKPSAMTYHRENDGGGAVAAQPDIEAQRGVAALCPEGEPALPTAC